MPGAKSKGPPAGVPCFRRKRLRAGRSPLRHAHVPVCTPRLPKGLRPCWTGLFEHSLIALDCHLMVRRSLKLVKICGENEGALLAGKSIRVPEPH